MTIERYLNKLSKDIVSDYYYRIVSNKKDYDKITKKKMIEAIMKEYSDPKNIINICTEKELKILEQLINNTFKINPKIHFYLINLNNKLLINFGNTIEIMSDIEENVKEGLKNIDWNQVKKRDRINEFIVPFIKVMGDIYDEVAINLTSDILNIPKEVIKEHCHTNKLFNYYVDTFTRFMPSLNQDITEFYYIEYFDYLEELDFQRKTYGKSNTKNMDLNDYINIFYNKVNVNNPKVEKMFKMLSHNMMAPIILDQININVLLNYAYNDFLQNISILLGEDNTKENLAIIKEGMREMPSGALNRLTLNEYEKLEQEEEEFEQEEEYIKQGNARLSKKDCDLFYKLYMALLDYTNETYHVDKSQGKIHKAKYVNLASAVRIRDYLWNNKQIIDEFITKNPYHFNNSELKILKEFNKGKIGNFVIAKFELNYTIFIDAENDTKLYKIKGLTNNIDEIIDNDDMPRFVTTAILPFKGYIIYDGLFTMADISLGLTFKKSVRNALKNGEYQEL